MILTLRNWAIIVQPRGRGCHTDALMFIKWQVER